MARRKQEAQLQQEIETQEEWEDMLSKEGLFGKNFNKLHFPRLFYLLFNSVFQTSNFIEAMDKAD